MLRLRAMIAWLCCMRSRAGCMVVGVSKDGMTLLCSG